MDEQMTKTLVCDALRAAYWRKKPASGLMHHQIVAASIAQKLIAHYRLATRCKPRYAGVPSLAPKVLFTL